MNTHELRVSSTSIGTYLTCPRMFAYDLVTGHGKTANEAMSFGTLVHACIERKLLTGEWPSYNAILAMDGNYDPPRKALIDFPKLWSEVEEVMRTIDPCEYVGEGNFEVERALDDFNITACDGAILCGGFLDLWDADRHILWDWKTRSSLRYAPKTREDFLANPQLVYYAAAMAVHHDLDGVTIGHVNVMRPSQIKGNSARVAVYKHHISRWYLDAAWATLTQDVFPGMLAIKRAVVEGDKDSTIGSTRNKSACYLYGKNSCAHIKYCTDASAANPRGIFSNLLRS